LQKILKFEGGWHGLHDYAMVGNWRLPSEQPYPSPPPDVGGIPEGALRSVLVAPFDDLDRTARIAGAHADDLAAIIVEPLQRAVRPKPGFLAGLRELAHRHGALLVFDEVVTGFRLAYGGAREHYGVLPDLAVYGKALTAGFPPAAIAGRADVMATADPRRKGSLDYAALSGTLSGHALACASERALRAADSARATQFALELVHRGIFTLPGTKLYLSLAHTEADVDRTLDVMEDVLRVIR